MSSSAVAALQVPLYLTQDEEDAATYWRHREFKVYAVAALAGPESRPTLRRTYYARARDRAGAIRAVQRQAAGLPPGARFGARLAGPRELGCVPTSPAEALNPAGGSA